MSSAAAAPGVDLPVCETVRAWAPAWSLPEVLRRSRASDPGAVLPAPSRYLHPSLEVQRRPARGRCLVASAPLVAGELVLADAPLCTAKTQPALVDELTRLAKEDGELRRTLLGLCGDARDDAARAKYVADGTAPSQALVRHIVRHNNQLVSAPPMDGEPADEESWGVWPLAAVVNHSLKPNAARFSVGHTVCYRLLNDLAEGEEVTCNYLDPLMPRASRVEFLRVHELEDAGPDDLDAPEEVLVDLEKKVQEAEKAMEESRPQDALGILAKATSAVSDLKQRDPAFAPAFKAFAQVASCLGGGDNMQLEGLAMALEYISGREPASTVSCALAAEILAGALGELPEDDVAHIEAKVREHVRRVYGAAEGMFEALNPDLARRLGGDGGPAHGSAVSPSDGQANCPVEVAASLAKQGGKKRELSGEASALPENEGKRAKASSDQ